MDKFWFLLCIVGFIIPKYSLSQNDICSYCNGKSVIKCNICNKNGTSCSRCNGTGFIPCPFQKAYSTFHPISVNNTSTSSRPQNHTSHYNYDKTVSKSTYTAQNNPNIVDNSEEINKVENCIKELEHKKTHCYLCHGKSKVLGGPCFSCNGTGSIKMGYRTPQYFTCNWCNGKGRKENPCSECQNTDLLIRVLTRRSETLKETHGMDKETEKFYYEHQNRMMQMERDYQNAINTIADPYIENSDSYKSSIPLHPNGKPLCPDCKGSGKCHICKGYKMYENEYADYRIMNCDFCKQTGNCPMCHGSGYIR